MPEQRGYLLTLLMLAITLSVWAQQNKHEHSGSAYIKQPPCRNGNNQTGQ